MAERKVIVGVFLDRAQAEKAVNDLESAGFNENQIGFAVRKPGEPELNISDFMRSRAGSGQGRAGQAGSWR